MERTSHEGYLCVVVPFEVFIFERVCLCVCSVNIKMHVCLGVLEDLFPLANVRERECVCVLYCVVLCCVMFVCMS
jgi:hypothetical protein